MPTPEINPPSLGSNFRSGYHAVIDVMTTLMTAPINAKTPEITRLWVCENEITIVS